MIDRRSSDLSYGHLGEASYDLGDRSWHFSSDKSAESSLQPLQPLQESIPPSMRVLPESNKVASKVRRSQERWIQRALPEAGPARAVILSVTKAPTFTSFAKHPSTVLAIGKAADIDQTTGSKTTQIMTMVSGEAGSLLRLVKPRREALKLAHDTQLRTLNPVAGEECYWSGNGGAIQMVTFGADIYGFTSWLAVLKAESTTILRPIYHRDQTLSAIALDMGKSYQSSRLSPNPVLTLMTERTGGRPHADVSFNPWYIRQFAIVDQEGHWSLWDIEGQKRKRTTFEAKPGKSGHIQDDLSPDRNFESHNSGDGWGRILWAGGVSTLILCDRRNLAVFDLKAAPKRLFSPELVHSKSVDWILDMKRSPLNLNEVFVLTTRQIYWLQVSEAGQDPDEQLGYAGVRILLSCQHFRNDEDESAVLELLGESEGCTVLLYSAQSQYVNTYRFSMESGESPRPLCSRGFFTTNLSSKGKTGKHFLNIQTLCLLPTTFTLNNLRPMSGTAKQYMEHNVRFYQLFGLSENLGLYHATCATKWIAPGKTNPERIRHHNVLVPAINNIRKRKIKKSARVVEDQFIVPDGLEEEADVLASYDDFWRTPPKYSAYMGNANKAQRSQFSYVDASRLFRASFLGKDFEGHDESASPARPQNMVEHAKAVQSGIEERSSLGFQGLMTLFDLLEYPSFSEDVDEAASALKVLVGALSSAAQTGDPVNATLTAIRPSPFVQSDGSIVSSESMPYLSDVYDNLVDLWVSCLPRQIPGSIRLAKEKLIRGIAAELCLSSLAVFFRNKSVILPHPAESHEVTDFALPVRSKPPHDSSETQDEESFRASSTVPVPGLPTPATTPSLHSDDNTASLRDFLEDGAISRLRGYAVSIKPQPPLGILRSAILAHWPSAPGADPSKYSWNASRQSIVDDEDIDNNGAEALLKKREQDRRRRRTEKFLKRQRVNTIDAASAPLPLPAFGSQPDLAQHPGSSQATNIPMTQPDRGTFGSRIGQKGFKKRRTMGF